MTMVLPYQAIAPLRLVSEAGLTATARKWTESSVRQPGGVYVKTFAWGPEIPGRLNPLALDSPLRGDVPSSARKWTLSLPTGTQIKAGEQWKVSGTTNGEVWTRTVKVDEVLFPRSNELVRRALCVDVASNP